MDPQIGMTNEGSTSGSKKIQSGTWVGNSLPEGGRSGGYRLSVCSLYSVQYVGLHSTVVKVLGVVPAGTGSSSGRLAEWRVINIRVGSTSSVSAQSVWLWEGSYRRKWL